jgi:Spermidine/putrescine-binding periplasmic protein
MKRLSLILLALVLVLSFIPSAFAAETIKVFNWEDYISEEVFELFEQETGIKVDYSNFTTNEDMLIQVESNPGYFDVAFPSDYIIERMITGDMLEKINFDNIPNFNQIAPNLVSPSYDPTGEYSVPYMWGTVGILYNTTMVDETVDSWAILWDTKYQNKVFMYASIRDSMGVALKALGYSMNTRNIAELEAGKDKLIEQKRSGMVKAYYVDETKDKMVAGEGALAVMWSGDAQYAIDLNEDLTYVVPKEGSNIWVDGMVIPKGSKNKENAEKFIDFLCRPDIAQINCEEIWYSSPNTGAIELMGEEYTENLTMNPTQDIIDRCEFFNDLGPAYTAVYNTLWEEVTATK